VRGLLRVHGSWVSPRQRVASWPVAAAAQHEPGAGLTAPQAGPEGTGLRLHVVGRGGVEPPTFHFSGGRSYQLSYLPTSG
jgi:hypothetical protein